MNSTKPLDAEQLRAVLALLVDLADIAGEHDPIAEEAGACSACEYRDRAARELAGEEALSVGVVGRCCDFLGTTTSALQQLAVAPMPGWAEVVGPWRREGAGARRELVGVTGDGARVRQEVEWEPGGWVSYSNLVVLERGPQCPGWCGEHLADMDGIDIIKGLSGTDGVRQAHPIVQAGSEAVLHRCRVRVGDCVVVIEETTGRSEVDADPEGVVVRIVDTDWVSGESVRYLAAALSQAAGLIDEPRHQAVPISVR